MPATLNFLNHLIILFFWLFMTTLVVHSLFFYVRSHLRLDQAWWVASALTTCRAQRKRFHSWGVFSNPQVIWRAASGVRPRRIPGDHIQTHGAVLDNCQVLWIRRCIFIQAAFKSRHFNGTFLLWHSSKAPVLIIRQAYKSRGAGLLPPPFPVYTWFMAVNRPQSEQKKKNSWGVQSLCLCGLFTNRLFSSIFISLIIIFIHFYFHLFHCRYFDTGYTPVYSCTSI